jgi:hypothetical protein
MQHPNGTVPEIRRAKRFDDLADDRPGTAEDIKAFRAAAEFRRAVRKYCDSLLDTTDTPEQAWAIAGEAYAATACWANEWRVEVYDCLYIPPVPQNGAAR